MPNILILVLALWCLCLLVLVVWKRELFTRTWREPYLGDLAILIESDDWGPGGDFHAERLNNLLAMLATHRDSCNRPAVLTADMVLSVPDTAAIRSRNYESYIRRTLVDHFAPVMDSFRNGMQQGTFVPQLHGMEHLYGEGVVKLAAQGDVRVVPVFEQDNWWDWESLDSPLQGHYVNGTQLPSEPVAQQEIETTIKLACDTFRQAFGFATTSTVAPCYLWNDTVERTWNTHNIRYIQTAGYRCTGRDINATYIQDPPVIRLGDRNQSGQIYLVRTAMYEPVDGKDKDTCLQHATQAYRQRLPVVISTHRYNYTRTEEECQRSIAGLDTVLTCLAKNRTGVRYLSSPELGTWIENNQSSLINPANNTQWPALKPADTVIKISAFLHRLWYRHEKLRKLAVLTGIIIPLYILIRLTGYQPPFRHE